MWLIQWAPGASLAGWACAAALAFLRDHPNDDGAPFLFLGMIIGPALWGIIAVCSVPLFFLARPLVAHLARTVTRWRGAVLAAAAVSPFLITAALARNRLEASTQLSSTTEWIAVVLLSVALGLGTLVAAEMWTLVFTSGQGKQAPFNELFDIGLTVRVKEDLEVLRLVLAGSAMALLSMLTVMLPIALIALLIIAYQRESMVDGQQWIQLVPFVILSPVWVALPLMTSYQLGLWYFVSVRVWGVLLLFAATAELLVHLVLPVVKLYMCSYLGCTKEAWTYAAVLWLVTVPGLAVISSFVRMSLRLARYKPLLDPVVRGWRAWPTNLLAPALRTLCLPSFLTALPRGRVRATFLFILVVILSALRTTLVIGPVFAAPRILEHVVSSEPPDGAARILLVVPVILVFALLGAIVSLNRRLAAWLLRRAQRSAASQYQTITELDTRAPILFLRSFKEEKRLLEPPAQSLLARMLTLRDRKRTLDEIVLDAASPVGPVVALGMPGEEAPPLGAARLYAENSEWQDKVRGLAQRSRAVIICVEEGHGVLWELQHLLTAAHSRKTLCILTPSTSSATILRAIEAAGQSGNCAIRDMLEQIRAHSAEIQGRRRLVGVRFPEGIVTPIYAEDESDYTHWCMVNLTLAALTST